MELNEQTLEQILTRQGEKFDHALKLQGEQFQQYMGVQVAGLRSDNKLLAEAFSGQ